MRYKAVAKHGDIMQAGMQRFKDMDIFEQNLAKSMRAKEIVGSVMEGSSEFSRTSYASYVKQRYEAGQPLEKIARNLRKDFNERLERELRRQTVYFTQAGMLVPMVVVDKEQGMYGYQGVHKEYTANPILVKVVEDK